MRIESGVDAAEILQALAQERGRDDQRERQPEIDDDERVAQAAAGRSTRDAAGPFQCVVDVDARRRPRRRHPEQHAGEHRRRQREQQDVGVDMDFFQPRQLVRRERDNRRRRQPSDDYAGAATDNRECNRLVNEQAEMSLLLAAPGILGTLTFTPLVIQLLASDAALRERLGRNARARAEREFDRKIVLRSLLDFYQTELLPERCGPTAEHCSRKA